MTVKTIYIIEQKLSHWTTVEPLIALFRNRNWNVVVLADSRFEETAKKYLAIQGQKASRGLVYRDVNKWWSFWPALFSPPALIVASDRYFYPKNLAGRKGVPLWLRFLSFFLNRSLFLGLVAERSVLIRTTHFTDLISLPEKAKSGITFIDRSLNWIWRRSQKGTRAVHVYSSLVKEKHADFTKKPILVAPNALYRPPTGFFEVKEYNKPRIIIPGRIDGRRRQYDWIEKLPEQLSKLVDIVMVGKVQSRSDIRFVHQLSEKGFEQIVTSGDAFIPFDEYDSLLYSADLLFVPLRKLENSEREVDRNLGAFFDGIRYGKSVLVPSEILTPPELQQNIVRYQNGDELVSLFQRLSDDKQFLDALREQALLGSRSWTNKQDEFMRQLEGLMRKF